MPEPNASTLPVTWAWYPELTLVSVCLETPVADPVNIWSILEGGTPDQLLSTLPPGSHSALLRLPSHAAPRLAVYVAGAFCQARTFDPRLQLEVEVQGAGLRLRPSRPGVLQQLRRSEPGRGQTETMFLRLPGLVVLENPWRASAWPTELSLSLLEGERQGPACLLWHRPEAPGFEVALEAAPSTCATGKGIFVTVREGSSAGRGQLQLSIFSAGKGLEASPVLLTPGQCGPQTRLDHGIVASRTSPSTLLLHVPLVSGDRLAVLPVAEEAVSCAFLPLPGGTPQPLLLAAGVELRPGDRLMAAHEWRPSRRIKTQSATADLSRFPTAAHALATERPTVAQTLHMHADGRKLLSDPHATARLLTLPLEVVQTFLALLPDGLPNPWTVSRLNPGSLQGLEAFLERPEVLQCLYRFPVVADLLAKAPQRLPRGLPPTPATLVAEAVGTEGFLAWLSAQHVLDQNAWLRILNDEQRLMAATDVCFHRRMRVSPADAEHVLHILTFLQCRELASLPDRFLPQSPEARAMARTLKAVRSILSGTPDSADLASLVTRLEHVFRGIGQTLERLDPGDAWPDGFPPVNRLAARFLDSGNPERFHALREGLRILARAETRLQARVQEAKLGPGPLRLRALVLALHPDADCQSLEEVARGVTWLEGLAECLELQTALPGWSEAAPRLSPEKLETRLTALLDALSPERAQDAEAELRAFCRLVELDPAEVRSHLSLAEPAREALNKLSTLAGDETGPGETLSHLFQQVLTRLDALELCLKLHAPPPRVASLVRILAERVSDWLAGPGLWEGTRDLLAEHVVALRELEHGPAPLSKARRLLKAAEASLLADQAQTAGVHEAVQRLATLAPFSGLGSLSSLVGSELGEALCEILTGPVCPLEVEGVATLERLRKASEAPSWLLDPAFLGPLEVLKSEVSQALQDLRAMMPGPEPGLLLNTLSTLFDCGALLGNCDMLLDEAEAHCQQHLEPALRQALAGLPLQARVQASQAARQALEARDWALLESLCQVAPQVTVSPGAETGLGRAPRLKRKRGGRS